MTTSSCKIWRNWSMRMMIDQSIIILESLWPCRHDKWLLIFSWQHIKSQPLKRWICFHSAEFTRFAKIILLSTPSWMHTHSSRITWKESETIISHPLQLQVIGNLQQFSRNVKLRFMKEQRKISKTRQFSTQVELVLSSSWAKTMCLIKKPKQFQCW